MSNFRCSLIGLALVALTSCGKNKPDPNASLIKAMKETEAERLKQAAEQAILQEKKEKEREAKQEAKEAAQRAVTAPISAQEFKLSITPDASIKGSFVVPVHVLTVNALAADSWREKSAASYWKSPAPTARKLNFGSKPGASQSTVSMSVPFRTGHSHVVVVVKLNTAQEASRPYVYELKRQPNSADPLSPIRRPLQLRLTSGGLQAY